MKKGKLLYKSGALRIHETDNENENIVEFTDEVVTDTKKQKISFKGKGTINSQISAFLFRFLDSYHIKSYFIRGLSEREILVKKIEPITIVVTIRNVAAGSLVERYGVMEGKELDCPLFEFYLKDEEHENPMINEDHIVSFGYASAVELKEIHRLASKLNVILRDFFRRRALKLIDFTVEFGRFKNKVVLVGGLCPDTFQLWDLQSDEKFDVFRLVDDAQKLKNVYQVIHDRLFA
ncbi:phosphoribosylaminoimidazolesuccinocarboxamide synthase [candidate division KSB1 bacterium]|nr:phosphoribosylaminoimidazolesuccinocarboxamide synthase [candidate division KSB1 bacterium]